MSRVIVYSTVPCGYCAQAKALLAKRGIEFTEINLAKDPAGRAELAERTGMMSFPQVVVDDEVLGGFTELRAADAHGLLRQLAA